MNTYTYTSVYDISADLTSMMKRGDPDYPVIVHETLSLLHDDNASLSSWESHILRKSADKLAAIETIVNKVITDLTETFDVLDER